MNFTPTPAQAAMIEAYELPWDDCLDVTPPRVLKPRYTTEELKDLIVAKMRLLQRSLMQAEMPHRGAMCGRFGSHAGALRAASVLLTPEERELFVWRCVHCKKTGFADARGHATHQRRCKKRRGDEG